MSLVIKNGLYYKDYKWTDIKEDDSRVKGLPDHTFFNRNEGYEMLYFINEFSEKHDLFDIPSIIKIERMIKEEVPSNIRSQENVAIWMESNWENSKI